MPEDASAVGGEATQGYWEPHTSSIDFCESNYTHTSFIAEVHNVWSSLLGLSLVGLFGSRYGNPTSEWRFTLVYWVLIVIGVGSAGLHATLHWVFQSSDELPMIYLVIAMTYAVLECEAPKGKSKFPYLLIFLVGLSIVNTVVYYIFQQFYFVFLGTFSLLTIIASIGLVRLVFYRPNRRPEPKKLFWMGEVWYTMIGVPVWCLDMLLCHHVSTIADSLPFWALGITPHVIWHFAAGIGAYVLTLCCACCRMETLGINYKLAMVLGGILPILIVFEDPKKES